MDESKEHLLERNTSFIHEEHVECQTPLIPWLYQKHTIALLASLTLSLLANTLLILQVVRFTYLGPRTSISNDGRERTKYGTSTFPLRMLCLCLIITPAGLARDLSVDFLYHSPYESKNETLADELWNSISIDPGVVALSDGYVEEMRLPKAQRFPWDDSKGIYLLNAYHNMHCLVCRRIHLRYYFLRLRRVPTNQLTSTESCSPVCHGIPAWQRTELAIRTRQPLPRRLARRDNLQCRRYPSVDITYPRTRHRSRAAETVSRLERPGIVGARPYGLLALYQRDWWRSQEYRAVSILSRGKRISGRSPKVFQRAGGRGGEGRVREVATIHLHTGI